VKISVDIEIDSPKSRVWAAITDIDNSVAMISGIVDLKVLDRPEGSIVGLKWMETRKIFGKESSETMWITDSKDEEYYFTRAENHGAIYITKMEVADSNGKTTLSMSFSGTSESTFIKLMSSIMGIFVKKSMVKLLQQDLEDIKNFVEKTD